MKTSSKSLSKRSVLKRDLIPCHLEVLHCSLLSVFCSFIASLLVCLPLKINERLNRCHSFTQIFSLNCVVLLLGSLLWSCYETATEISQNCLQPVSLQLTSVSAPKHFASRLWQSREMNLTWYTHSSFYIWTFLKIKSQGSYFMQKVKNKTG